MKRLFSKRSGFTLVEIIIAFAIFAIMASMIVQVLNLMVRRKVRNKQFEDNLSIQEEAFIARTKNMDYTAAEADGQLVFKFKDNGGNAIPVEDIDYQLKNWDPDNAKNGINYFAGNYTYDLDTAGSEYLGGEDPEGEDPDAASVGGSTQMSRFDTRITGTKGIDWVKVQIAKSTTESAKYTVSVTVDDSSVSEIIHGHQQVTLFFAEDKSGAKPISVVSINDGVKDENSFKKVKLCGTNGVNIHCDSGSSGFNGNTVVFSVELDKDVELDDLGFGEGDNVAGSNIKDGITYAPYTVEDKNGNEVTYVNIFGAYEKKATTTGGSTDGDKTEE